MRPQGQCWIWKGVKCKFHQALLHSHSIITKMVYIYIGIGLRCHYKLSWYVFKACGILQGFGLLLNKVHYNCMSYISTLHIKKLCKIKVNLDLLYQTMWCDDSHQDIFFFWGCIEYHIYWGILNMYYHDSSDPPVKWCLIKVNTPLVESELVREYSNKVISLSPGPYFANTVDSRTSWNYQSQQQCVFYPLFGSKHFLY